MTKVFFYHNVQDRLGAACSLLARAWAQKKDFTVFVPAPEQAQLLDRLLWTRFPLSFLPHCHDRSPLAAETPILLTQDLQAPRQDQRLLNLGDEIPPNFERFTNLIEVVSQADEDKIQARQRFKHYKAHGHEIVAVDMAPR
ncbi:MAG: DNA polymerase III subunit chi [Azovibrio sp.]|uniref:DNA polymerase III subunit chi n=1 Tax=Azovibrio sp. TaxID=1872673 RepID=UPI003C794973